MLRGVGTFAKRIPALEPTIVEMRESVTRHPSGIFRPVPTPWHAAEIFFLEYRYCPVEIDRDVGQPPTNLGDRNDGIAPSSVKSHEGIWVFVGRGLYLPGYGAVCLEEGVVVFSGVLQGNDMGDQRRMFHNVNAGNLVVSRGLSLSFLNTPRGEFVFVETTLREIYRYKSGFVFYARRRVAAHK